VRTRIDAACIRAGRDPAEVTLVAVTKYAPVEAVRGIVELGVVDLGESRPQQLLERAEMFDSRTDALPVRWHQIGQLQRNKVRKVLPRVELIHSVASLKLAQAIDRIADEEGLQPRVLIEVNISGEESKEGFAPDELRELWPVLASLGHVRIDGLMTMAPYSSDPEAGRPVFAELRRLREELGGRAETRGSLPQLSMGMSGDFEVAIEEGATIIRPGSVLFSE